MLTTGEVRGATREDAAAIAGLLAAAEAVDRTEEHWDTADVLEELESPITDPARDWLLVERAGELVAAAMLAPRAPGDAELAVAVDGTVHPAHRGTGIASELLPRAFQRAREHVAERAAALDRPLTPVVRVNALQSDSAIADIATRAGMTVERWSFDMAADLATAAPEVEPAVPDGFRLTSWEGADHDELLRVHNETFADHPAWSPWDREMWHQYVAGSRAHRPAHSLLLREGDGRVAAYLHTQEYDAATDATGRREAYVAKVGTTPAHRREGLATLMLQVALHRYRREGYVGAALDVDSQNPTGALGVYERAGFRTRIVWATYRSR